MSVSKPRCAYYTTAVPIADVEAETIVLGDWRVCKRTDMEGRRYQICICKIFYC